MCTALIVCLNISISLFAVDAKICNYSDFYCKYNLTIPSGWDTIPRHVLVEKNEMYKNIHFALYPMSQSDYFTPKSMLITFVPTAKSLNLFTFREIEQTLNKQTESDSVYLDGRESDVENGRYIFIISSSLDNDTISLRCKQYMLLTRFGYLTVFDYLKGEEDTLFMSGRSLISNVVVDNDYIYSEPKRKGGLDLKSVIYALAIGVIVYIVMTLFQKRRHK